MIGGEQQQPARLKKPSETPLDHAHGSTPVTFINVHISRVSGTYRVVGISAFVCFWLRAGNVDNRLNALPQRTALRQAESFEHIRAIQVHARYMAETDK
jgi:hypothetical protein